MAEDRSIPLVRTRSCILVPLTTVFRGWDWGPSEVSAGPYKDIRLELFDVRIADLYAHTKLSDDLRYATVKVEAAVEGNDTAESLNISLHGPGISEPLSKSVGIPKHDKLQLSFEIENPHLWWPHGHGDQPLYKVTAKLANPVYAHSR